jgi:hypothetical protein
MVDKNEVVKKYLTAFPLSVIAIPQNARAIGLALGELGWPRRQIADRIQLRFEYWLDAGYEYRTHEGDIFPIEEDSLDRLFDDPGYRWMSEFPARCRKGPLMKTPPLVVQQRLQLLELGVRTPPYGMAI